MQGIFIARIRYGLDISWTKINCLIYDIFESEIMAVALAQWVHSGLLLYRKISK